MDEMVKIHERLTSLEGSMKTIFNRVDSVDDKLESIENKQDIMHEMNTNIKIIALNTENLGKEVNLVKADVKDLKEKPGKRWDTLTTVIITAIASGLITFILSNIFK
jgi:archaellum component FlaC